MPLAEQYELAAQTPLGLVYDLGTKGCQPTLIQKDSLKKVKHRGIEILVDSVEVCKGSLGQIWKVYADRSTSAGQAFILFYLSKVKPLAIQSRARSLKKERAARSGEGI